MIDQLPKDAHPPQWLTFLVQAILVGLLVLSTVHDCQAADEWTTGEKVAEGAYLSLHTIDYLQTRWIATHAPEWHESFNTVLGTHPSAGRVNAWFLTTSILQPVIAYALPRPWRDIWIGAGLVCELRLTTHNASVGIKMDLP